MRAVEPNSCYLRLNQTVFFLFSFLSFQWKYISKGEMVPGTHLYHSLVNNMIIIQQQTAAVYGYKNKCHWLPRLISAVILHQPQHSALVLLVHSRTHYPEISWHPLQSTNIMVFLHIYITSVIIAAVADTVHILIAVLLLKRGNHVSSCKP